jgi:hypothetical protein
MVTAERFMSFTCDGNTSVTRTVVVTFSCPFAKYVCSATISSLYEYHLDITTFSIPHLLPQL